MKPKMIYWVITVDNLKGLVFEVLVNTYGKHIVGLVILTIMKLI